MKEYMGDGVYAELDAGGIVLTAENGISIQETIYIEPEVLAALNRFASKEAQ